jgi:hypothetical protein
MGRRAGGSVLASDAGDKALGSEPGNVNSIRAIFFVIMIFSYPGQAGIKRLTWSTLWYTN